MDISLKNYSIKQIEETIATALSNLCEEPVRVEISSVVKNPRAIELHWKFSIEATIEKPKIPDNTIPF